MSAEPPAASSKLRVLTLGLMLGGALFATVALARSKAAPSPARVVADNATRAKAAAKKGDWTKVVGELEAALAAARGEAPLEVRVAAVSKTPHGGLGMYEPAPGGKVAHRDVPLYVEVANVGHRDLEDGTFEVFLEVSAAFTYQDGTELGERDLGVHRYYPRTRAGVVSFGLDVGLSEKAPGGRYDLALKVKDRVSGKEATAPLFFVLPKLAQKPKGPPRPSR